MRMRAIRSIAAMLVVGAALRAWAADPATNVAAADAAAAVRAAGQQATNALQQVREQSPIIRARDLRLEGRIDEALEIIRRLLEKNPQDVDALVQRGFCWLRQGKNLELALGDFREVMVRSPGYTDAFVGAALVLRRLGDRKAAEAALHEGEIGAGGITNKLRYLAETCWREGYYPMARRLDAQVPPLPDRVLLPDPTEVRVRYAHSWVVRRDDWDQYGIAVSHKIRPDIAFGADVQRYHRFGRRDWSGSVDASYRYRSGLSFNADVDFSDKPGFVADRRYRVGMEVAGPWKLGLSPRYTATTYGDRWSERMGIGVTRYLGNWFGSYSYSTGWDTDHFRTESHGVSIGYAEEQRYTVVASASTGDEFIDIQRRNRIVFREDKVDSASVRGRWYIEKDYGMDLGYLMEWREQNVYRREGSIGLFVRF